MTNTEARWRSKSGRPMPIASHLRELRRRLLISAVTILLAAVGGFLVSDRAIDLLRAPIATVAEASGRGAALNFDTVTQAFDIKVQIALTIAIVVASPVWLYQLWAFVLPALLKKEKRYAVGFLAVAVPLFLGGVAAGWYVMPHIVELMLGFAPAETLSNLGAKYYYDFVLKLLLATGIAFVLPVFLVVLNFLGVISGRAILKAWRVAILAIVLFTAIATPAADLFSMFLLAVPMVALYFIAVAVGMLHDRRVARRTALLIEGESL